MSVSRPMSVGRLVLYGTAVALAVTARTAAGQGAVTGQVTITERPGETTNDLGNTVVYLDAAAGSAASRVKVPELKEQMAMQSRQFAPRVRVVTVGSKIEFPNQDPFSHNIFSNAAGASFDLGLYGRGGMKDVEFKKAGAFPIYCNIHSRMTGYVVVVNTPFRTETGGDGRFSVTGVPAGKYTVHFWHERAPEISRELVVSAAGVSGVDAKLDASGFKVAAHKNKFGQDYKASGERY